MPPSLAPAPFYGDSQTSLDSIRRIRFSRLFVAENTEISPEEKKRNSVLPAAKPRFKGVKLFPNISHGIKKAKLKGKPLKLLNESTVHKVIEAKSAVSVRKKILEKFDFSRTPYALPARKPRITLDEEMSKKRKFFKSTIETPVREKPTVVENNVTELEFGDMNGPEEESFTAIKKGVSDILHQFDWMTDDDSIRPQITRQSAVEILSPVSTPNKSYLTLSNLSPNTPQLKNIESPSYSLSDHRKQNHSDENRCFTPSTNILTPISTPNNSRVPEENPNTNNSKKLYPLFTSASKNILSDVTNKNQKQRNILNKAAAPNDQYQIDAGQKVIGPTECTSCGMVFDIGDPSDKQRHDVYHNKRKDIKLKTSKSENVVGYCGTDRIILIKYSDDAKKRKKVLEILKITEEEMGKGYAFQPLFSAYLYVRNEIILGCLIAEPNVQASRIIHSNGIVLLSEDKQNIKCGVNRIWVKAEFRGNKIATELMNCLRKNFVFGEILDLDDIAFSPTTANGDAFAIKYCKRNDYFTYIGSYTQ